MICSVFIYVWGSVVSTSGIEASQMGASAAFPYYVPRAGTPTLGECMSALLHSPELACSGSSEYTFSYSTECMRKSNEGQTKE